MSSSSKGPTTQNLANDYNQLLDELQDMTQAPREEVDSNLPSLKNRAQKLLVWITRHQNDVDRHGLAAICKEGKQTVLSILKAGDDTDTADLEGSLWELEARQMACNEAFAEELQGFTSISPEIIDNLNPDRQKAFSYRIAKAIANIYKSTDTPEALLAEIEAVHNEVKEHRIDDIIEKTLDNPNTPPVVKKHLDRKSLRDYIRHRMDYMDDFNITTQVSKLLEEKIYDVYISTTSGMRRLPREFDYFMARYNTLIEQLEWYNESECQYPKLSIEEPNLGLWSVKNYASDIEAVFREYDSKLEAMASQLLSLFNRRANLCSQLNQYCDSRKPSPVKRKSWNDALKRLCDLRIEINSSSRLSHSFTSLEQEASRLISEISY